MESHRQEILLGFHLRAVLGATDSNQFEGPEGALVRERVRHLLSVDSNILASCEDKNLLSRVFLNFDKAGFSIPNGLQLFDLGKSSLRFKTPSLGATILGITTIGDAVERMVKMHGISLPTISLETLASNGWRHMGYDVGDMWLYSGLVNFYSKTKCQNFLSKEMVASINEFGLISSPEIAEKFLVVCESQIPEHAPFFLYGLWTPDFGVTPPNGNLRTAREP